MFTPSSQIISPTQNSGEERVWNVGVEKKSDIGNWCCVGHMGHTHRKLVDDISRQTLESRQIEDHVKNNPRSNKDYGTTWGEIKQTPTTGSDGDYLMGSLWSAKYLWSYHEFPRLPFQCTSFGRRSMGYPVLWIGELFRQRSLLIEVD